ncbi:Rieske (2Fe-2S) protein [Mesorhizobium sp. AR07]|uniref:Rieske (2Fe-2S) protein n=1 Tax=Mesorhizobium sp. AR07 TaxID=2865838 RepID=UPI00215ECD21|nr:Rieske (2Fe-2S) protein [Mesorhizobium sp. AR07]UVK45982.1 Rieske (2Fe-2S) protein [Mesorhizobium sp. AR07]
MKHEICKIADIPRTGSLIAPFFGREVHVYRSGERIRAAANVCLHFGGPLDCKDGRLVCQWHRASFDMASGDRLDGPAPKTSRLMFLSTRVEDGALNYVWGE